jgi:NADH dehydrogenase [ubiquinone] 1 alpha subcomplex assembly factor 7
VTSPLLPLLTRRITLGGPISVATFMAEALGHPTHGYYITRDPLGTAGDFTTAPEISQMFGEMVGIWLADCWLRLGSPDPVTLVELGPGRGTLMADALRATRRVPGFHTALRLALVETSPTLRARQATSLQGYQPHWYDSLAEVPAGPMLLVANEFFDALPIRQFVRGTHGWAERKVGLGEAGALAFMLEPAPVAAALHPVFADPRIPPGAVAELCPAGIGIAREIGQRLATAPGAALLIDYGYAGPAIGDTLQALRAHRMVPVLDDPGLADLTAHVDFTALAQAARQAGAETHPAPGHTIDQGDWLRAMGIEARAAALTRQATVEQAQTIATALLRLTEPGQMGRLFKTIALASPGFGPPAGFAP